jgi:hypothetical protein
MKYSLTVVVLFLSKMFLSQITPSNFDSEILNNKILIEINKMRVNSGLDTLVPSTSVFNIFSKPNCNEVSRTNSLYHPSNSERYKNPYLRELIIGEFKKEYGGESFLLSNGVPKMDMYENCYRSNLDFENYDELAKHLVQSWSKSEAHNRIQSLVYSSSNLPGVFSCHSIMNEDGMLYVFVNFVKIYRI